VRSGMLGVGVVGGLWVFWCCGVGGGVGVCVVFWFWVLGLCGFVFCLWFFIVCGVLVGWGLFVIGGVGFVCCVDVVGVRIDVGVGGCCGCVWVVGCV